MKKALLIGGSMHTREYALALAHLGVQVTTCSDLQEAMQGIRSVHPGVITIILPNYYDEVSAFVAGIRSMPDSRSTPIIYIGGPIEGGNQTTLRAHGVKTLTLGPVQTDEMARFIEKQIY
jgi:hypothetical protein